MNLRRKYICQTRANPIKEMNKLGISLDRRIMLIGACEDDQIQWLKEQLSYVYKNKEKQKDPREKI